MKHFTVYIPPRQDGSCAITHMSEVKVIVRTNSGQLVDRLSPWAKYVVQPPKEANQGTNFKQRVWHPPAHEVSSNSFHILENTFINFASTHRNTCSKIVNQPSRSH